MAGLVFKAHDSLNPRHYLITLLATIRGRTPDLMVLAIFYLSATFEPVSLCLLETFCFLYYWGLLFTYLLTASQTLSVSSRMSSCLAFCPPSLNLCHLWAISSTSLASFFHLTTIFWALPEYLAVILGTWDTTEHNSLPPCTHGIYIVVGMQRRQIKTDKVERGGQCFGEYKAEKREGTVRKLRGDCSVGSRRASLTFVQTTFVNSLLRGFPNLQLWPLSWFQPHTGTSACIISSCAHIIATLEFIINSSPFMFSFLRLTVQLPFTSQTCTQSLNT